MAKFIHSVLAQNQSVTAGTTISYDLPVNPLSHVMCTLRFAQSSTNLQVATTSIFSMISKLEVLFRGSAILSLNGTDLMALQTMMFGFENWTSNAGGDDNDLRYFSFIVPFGRKLYDPNECYPRSQRGELLMQVTYAASFTDIDGVSAQFETVELPEASPSQYMRTTTLSITPTATGEFDVDLPIGNRLAAVIFFGTTIPAGSTATRTINYTQFLVDNQRIYFSQTNFETQRSIAGLRHKPPIAQGFHTHQIDGAAFAQYMDTSAVKYEGDLAEHYLMWDFNPTNDDLYIFDTAGASDVVARISAGDTNPIRVLPLELVGA